MSTVVIPSDFKLPIGISALGLAVSGLGNLTGGCILSALGLGLAVQATRVSIEFDDEVSTALGLGVKAKLEPVTESSLWEHPTRKVYVNLLLHTCTWQVADAFRSLRRCHAR